MARKGAVLSLSVALSALAFGANLSPITPKVDHQKKATCGISWTIQSGGLIKGFEIRRGLTDVYEEADVIAIVDNKTAMLTDWGADRYTDYYYWVVAFDYNDENTTWYGTDGGGGIKDKSRYACKNHRYWSSGDVYLTASVKSISIGSTLPLYFKIDIGTPTEPFYDHMKPDMIEIREMLDNQGRPANDIAYIFSNRDEEYENKAEGVDTYLSASGAFGYLLPLVLGISPFPGANKVFLLPLLES